MATFTLMPVGIPDGQYTFYNGERRAFRHFQHHACPLRRARQLWKALDYAFLFETASALTIRDAYMDFKPWSAFKIMVRPVHKCRSQWKSELRTPRLMFYNRSIISVLYPDAGGAFRAPGIDVHGDLAHGAAEYWVAFNGQGLLKIGNYE